MTSCGHNDQSISSIIRNIFSVIIYHEVYDRSGQYNLYVACYGNQAIILCYRIESIVISWDDRLTHKIRHKNCICNVTKHVNMCHIKQDIPDIQFYKSSGLVLRDNLHMPFL